MKPKLNVVVESCNIKDGETLTVFFVKKIGVAQVELRNINNKIEIFYDAQDNCIDIKDFKYWKPKNRRK